MTYRKQQFLKLLKILRWSCAKQLQHSLLSVYEFIVFRTAYSRA